MDWGDCVITNIKDPITGKVEEVVDNVATLDCLFPVLQNVINAAFMFAGVVAVILIIYSGIKFILSGGDPKQVEGARKTMTYAIIGFVVVLFSVFILNLISTVTGVNCIKFLGFTNCQ